MACHRGGYDESLQIRGEDREGVAPQRRHCPEGALVEAGDPIGPMPVGEHGKRGVGKAQLEVPVATASWYLRFGSFQVR